MLVISVGILLITQCMNIQRDEIKTQWEGSEPVICLGGS
jgi:hypothetical protein